MSDIPEPELEETAQECEKIAEEIAAYEQSKPVVKLSKAKPAQAKAKQTTKSVSIKEVAEFQGTALEGMSFREAQAHVKATVNALNIKGVKASIKRVKFKANQAAGLVAIINHVNTVIGYITEADCTDKQAIAKAEQEYEVRNA